MPTMETGYGQFCPIAKASEIFATRWTPLIMRELMAGMRSFNDIHRGVPLISRAVLVTRLRELEDHGIIERRLRADSVGHEYWLTPAGDAFRSAVSALGHWGLVHTPHHMAQIHRDEIGDFSAKYEIDGKSRIFRAYIDARAPSKKNDTDTCRM
jgi:DNA-binding HxlR family transcriptional regulator